MGDAHRLGPVLGRQCECGLQHLARGPAGISNVRASFLGGHVCLLIYRMPELRDTTLCVERVGSARIRARGFSPLRGGGRSFLPSRGPLRLRPPRLKSSAISATVSGRDSDAAFGHWPAWTHIAVSRPGHRVDRSAPNALPEGTVRRLRVPLPAYLFNALCSLASRPR